MARAPVTSARLRTLSDAGESAPPNDQAFIYVHGFASDSLRYEHSIGLRDNTLAWDAHLFEYPTGYFRRGLPTFTKLAETLSAELKKPDGRPRYRENVFIANSAGGLIVLRALLSDPALRANTRAALLFATPVGGVLANESQWWKQAMEPFVCGNPQVNALKKGSEFLKVLNDDLGKAVEPDAPGLPPLAMTWGTRDKSVQEWSIKQIRKATSDVKYATGRTHSLRNGTFHEDILPQRVLGVLNIAPEIGVANV